MHPLDGRQESRGKVVRIYKKGTDHKTSGFQESDKIREEEDLQEFCRLYAEKPECLSPLRDRGEERNGSGDFSESDETVHPGILSPS